jgi:integrase
MRKREPFYKHSHKAYYVEINGRQIRLGTEEKAAWDEYHRLMAGKQPATDKTPARDIIDQFLRWTERRSAPLTVAWYTRHLTRFKAFIGGLTVGELRKHHVTQWVADEFESDASASYLNGAIRAAVRPFLWAFDEEIIATNPLPKVKRPTPEPRENYTTPEQFAKALALVSADDPFRDLLEFLWLTGARPQEAVIIEACQWDREAGTVTLPRKSSKGKKYNRVIYLNPHAAGIIARLALKRPDGALFRNKVDNAWGKNSLTSRFRGLRKRLGFPFHAYLLRHGWVTQSLKKGVDSVTVGILAGHRDPSMVAKVYQHLAKDNAYLHEKNRQASG